MKSRNCNVQSVQLMSKLMISEVNNVLEKLVREEMQ